MFVNKLRNCLTGIITLAVFFWAGPAAAEWKLNLTQGVTPISREVYDLHMLILWIVTIIGIVVFGVIFWSVYYHRKSRGAVAAKFHHSTVAEFTWTIIPILILIGMAIPATKTLIMMEQTGDADITVKITGHQWKWEYDYKNEGIRFFSSLSQDSSEAAALNSGKDLDAVNHYLLDVDNPLVLPVNKKVRLLTTAKDVLHAWWVPDLGWKRDAIPGYINDNWAFIEKPGVYRGQCTELCGAGHGYMPVVVKAVPEEEYLAWVEEIKTAQAAAAADSDKEWSAAELQARGEEVYKNACAVCHQANGKGVPGAFPALDGSAVATGPVAVHIDLVVHGKNMMPAFGSQLSASDMAAVITYERNAWGNRTGDVVQPQDIKAANQ